MSLPHLLYSLQHHPGSTVVMVLSTDYLHENSLIYTCNTSFCKKKKSSDFYLETSFYRMFLGNCTPLWICKRPRKGKLIYMLLFYLHIYVFFNIELVPLLLFSVG